jgi:2',5'-phosphodiesterase
VEARPPVARLSSRTLDRVVSKNRATEQGTGTTSARIVTYNVLSSSLCEADYHVKCTPRDLNQKVRLNRVIDLLAPEVAKGSIICLQEVSTKWAGSLHAHFSGLGYYMIHMGYGGKFDGYMGCALAVPVGKYKVEASKMVRVSDLKQWPRLPPPPRRERLKNWVLTKWRRWKGVKPPVNAYEDTKRRSNQLLFLRLRDPAAAASFCVATYHMPCQFRVPEVMVSHAALALRYLQRLAREQPLVFCGDFNFKPGDAPYRLVTEGSLARGDPHYPTLPPEDKWVPTVEYPMRSAYKVANGEEPDYTNWYASDAHVTHTYASHHLCNTHATAGIQPILVSHTHVPVPRHPHITHESVCCNAPPCYPTSTHSH